MMRVLSFVWLIFWLEAPAFGQNAPVSPPRALALALEATRDGRWDAAAQLAARDGAVAVDLVEWHRLRSRLGTPDEIMDFLARNPDWPGLELLRKQSEEAMLRGSAEQVLAFFHDYAPHTGSGALNYARVLKDRGQQGEAEATLVLAWRTLDLSTEEHDAFVERHVDLLGPHHEARMEMALWRGLKDIKDMMPLVSEDLRKLAELRQEIEAGKKGVDAKIAKLDEAQKKYPGVAYEIFNRHISKDRLDKAIEVLLRQSRLQDGLGEPWRWASWRRAIARQLMRDGHAKMAYDVAAVHQLADGSNFADLEWLSGYIALVYLQNAELALDHFQRFRMAVKTPISLGRAGYWIGRAQDAMGDSEAAMIAYAEGAQHQTSFYGLLAAEKAGLPPDPSLAGQERSAPWREAAFTRSSVFQAAVLALASDQLNLAERFFTHLTESLSHEEIGQLAALLEEFEQSHLQVMVGKAAAKRGIVLPRPYYALHPLVEMDLPTPLEMALSIARRESEFDFTVSSSAGAEGLMQVIPDTAKDVAKELDLKYEPSKVLNDWRYNATIGSAYLARLAKRFNGNVVMIAAGYNAGPGRPVRWMERFGDPRQGDMDVVDWVEHIPFRETRNYVMRVAESVPVYRARLGKEPHPVPFSQELTGSTIVADPPAID